MLWNRLIHVVDDEWPRVSRIVEGLDPVCAQVPEERLEKSGLQNICGLLVADVQCAGYVGSAQPRKNLPPNHDRGGKRYAFLPRFCQQPEPV